MSPGPDLDRSSGADTLQLLVGGGSGQPEMLLVIDRPGSDGQVHLRAWTSNDWSAPPTDGHRNGAALLRDIEHWSRSGRALSQPLAAVRRWLDGRTAERG